MFGRKLPINDEQCVLCSRTRSHVRQLVVGLLGAVCSDCIRVSVNLVDLSRADAGASYGNVKKIEVVSGELNTEPPFLIELDASLARVFPDSDSVNLTLTPIARLVESEAARLFAAAEERVLPAGGTEGGADRPPPS
jgi:hypothetical protein